MSAWDIVQGLLSVAQVVVKAIANGDEEKVGDILSEDLKTSLAKARAEAEAYEKFGE